ncbi:MAG: ABC-F family ATP-binding cassette domain-containing protein [Desulfurellaceae bacterium]|nr:ABC-F family ATP-binding cassette domain-containing protein [Desulfurellaceae bacterium]
MLQLTDLSLAFGGQKLFHKLNWQLNRGDRVGLVGPNGAGKTSLFRLMMGQLEPDTGRVQHGREISLGYLPQEGAPIGGRSLFEEARSALPELGAIQRELARLHAVLETEDQTQTTDSLARYGQLQHRFEELGGWSADAQVAKVLSGLGFHQEQFGWPSEVFSGGWQMRIALAKLLLQGPDILLLDEPTNHLDLDSVLWLEGYLCGYAGSVIIVSHDRRFLDRTVTRIAAIHRHSLSDYTGNYSAFERQFAQTLEADRKAYEEQQAEIERITRFINTFRYNARKATQVQSRVKQLEKMARLPAPQTPPSGVRFHFPRAPRSGRVVLELKGVGKHYDKVAAPNHSSEKSGAFASQVQVFNNLDLTIERGDRIALLGVNGAGKSTLSRLLAGTEAPSCGQRVLGYQVVLDFYAQQQTDKLTTDRSVYQEIASRAAFDVVPQLRTLLGAFLFSGEAVDKPVTVLSGGEKSRLVLAKMLLQASNFLILDEPTNHLDLRTKEVLKQALQQFSGTFVLVSHDRDFLDGLVTKVIELQDGRLVSYPGSFEAFVARKEREAGGEGESQKSKGQGQMAKTGGAEEVLSAVRQAKRGKALQVRQKAARAQRSRQERRMAETERRIAELEEQQRAVEALMADRSVYTAPQRAREIATEYDTLKRELEEHYASWSELAEELDGETG